jgi:hypothetical protein
MGITIGEGDAAEVEILRVPGIQRTSNGTYHSATGRLLVLNRNYIALPRSLSNRIVIPLLGN